MAGPAKPVAGEPKQSAPFVGETGFFDPKYGIVVPNVGSGNSVRPAGATGSDVAGK